MDLPPTEFDRLVRQYNVKLDRTAFPPGKIGDILGRNYARALTLTLWHLEGGLTAENLFDAVRTLFHLTESEFAKLPSAIQWQGQTREIACKAGCAYCCSKRVTTTAPEALYLAHFIRSKRTAEQTDALRGRISAYLDRTEGVAALERVLALIPCPVLEEGMCSLYEARPAPCRSYHSLDLRKCIADFENPASADAVPYDPVRKSIEVAMSKGFNDACKALGLDMRELELVRALQIAIENEGALEAWLSGADVFGPAHRPDLQQAQSDFEKRTAASLPVKQPG